MTLHTQCSTTKRVVIGVPSPLMIDPIIVQQEVKLHLNKNNSRAADILSKILLSSTTFVCQKNRYNLHRVKPYITFKKKSRNALSRSRPLRKSREGCNVSDGQSYVMPSHWLDRRHHLGFLSELV